MEDPAVIQAMHRQSLHRAMEYAIPTRRRRLRAWLMEGVSLSAMIRLQDQDAKQAEWRRKLH